MILHVVKGEAGYSVIYSHFDITGELYQRIAQSREAQKALDDLRNYVSATLARIKQGLITELARKTDRRDDYIKHLILRQQTYERIETQLGIALLPDPVPVSQVSADVEAIKERQGFYVDIRG